MIFPAVSVEVYVVPVKGFFGDLLRYPFEESVLKRVIIGCLVPEG
jgi:hypothetical protein